MTNSALSLMPNDTMKYGIFLAPFHDLKENPTQAMQRDMWLLEYLDELGYAEAWIGEHHSGGFEIIACPEVFIAGAAERTKNIKLGTGVVSLPYHHPFMVAGRATQLDHMTRGRFMLGVGPGALVGDAYRMGIDPEAQRRMMNESLDVIVKLMEGDTVTMKSDWFEAKDAHLQIPPFTVPHTEMAVACARSPSGALAAGKHGLGMLSIGGTSDDALKAHANNWRIYTDHATAAGKPADRSKWRIVTFAHVAETREQARRDVAFGLQHFADYFREVATFPIIPPDVGDPLDYLINEGIACIGTPDDCIRHFERLWQGSEGGFGAALLLAHNWADWDATRKSYELMARFVHPRFQRHSNALREHSYAVAAGNRDTHVAAASRAVSGEIEKFQKKTA